MRRMNKRGQIYVLTVIIIAFVIYNLYLATNIVKETIIEDDFEELSLNYDVESAKFVNFLLEENVPDVIDPFERFSKLFTVYAKTKNPEFSLVYLFDYKGVLYVGNYFDESIKVSDMDGNRQVTVQGCFDKIDTSIFVGGLDLSIADVEIGDVASCIKEIPSLSNIDNLLLTIGDVAYPVDVSTNQPEIVIITREKKGEQRKVYTKGKFVDGIREG